MKKAKDINEFANNLDPGNFLESKDKDVYVPIYEDQLKLLRNMVINDQVESQAFFVAGQAGTGKTTALNFFKTETLEKHYHIKYINMRDFLDLSDVDIIDFLLAFAFALVKKTSIENSYYEKLVDLQKKHKGELLETVEQVSEREKGIEFKGEGSIGGGLLNIVKLKAEIIPNLKLDSNYRQTIRQVFRLTKPFLSKLVNEVIEAYVEKIARGKKLLVIIDDLDKMRKVEQINSIFIENRNYIFSLSCKKILSIPIYLAKMPEISNYSQYPIHQFILRLKPNPINGEAGKEEKEKIEVNWQMLRRVIRARVQEDITLIDNDALEEAIDQSGGIIRQLIRIVYVAAVNVRTLEGTKISPDDIKEAVNALRNNMAGTIISTNKINMLHTILEKNVPVSETSTGFIELLQSNNVLAYENGEPWYEVNPIIRNTVKVYAARQPKK
jgi:DNA polymerase III delta prime subunit